MKIDMKFKRWLAEMASFSIPPAEKVAVPCGMIHVPGGMPCKDGFIGALDMRFEGPPAYESPFNKFNNGSKFIAKLPGIVPTQYLVYHGGMEDTAVMPEDKAKAIGYPAVPDYWYERAEILDTDYNVAKPALGDHTGERQKMFAGK